MALPRKRRRTTVQFQLVDLEYASKGDLYKPLSPTVILYGRRMDGTAVTAKVTEFYPYMYIVNRAQDTDTIKKDLNRHLHTTFCTMETSEWGPPEMKITNRGQYRQHGQYVKSVEPTRRCNLYGYNQPETFLKVTTYNPKDVPVIRNALLERKWGYYYEKQTYECDFLFVLRFLVDKQIRGAGWVEMDVESAGSSLYHVQASNVRAVDLAQVAPLRILSFDIEVKGNLRCGVKAIC